MAPDLNSDDENPYDFIFKQDKAAPAATQTAGPNPKQMFLFIGFIVIILAVLAVAFSFITSTSKDKGTEAIAARAYQAEIARVFDLGDKNARNPVVLKRMATLRLIMLTDASRLDGVISAKGLTPTPLQLAQQNNTKNDSELTASLQTDRHDETYGNIIDKLFSGYYEALKSAEAKAKTTKERDTLTILRKNVEVIFATAGQSPDDLIIEEADDSATDPSTTDPDTTDPTSTPVTPDPGTETPVDPTTVTDPTTQTPVQ